MSVELHLPDLPEVKVALGPAAPEAAGPAPRPHMPWHLRLREALAAYIPLLLMALLALGTWWLVRHSPPPDAPREARAPRGEPDTTMNGLVLQRFDAAGRLILQVEGRQMRHYPDADRIEIDGVRIRSIAPDGRVTLASAVRAVGKGDGSEMQLLGKAQVTSSDEAGQPIEMKGDFLHAFFRARQVKSHLPVEVHRGSARLTAAGLFYDHGQRLLQLQGPMRGVFPPGSTR